MGWMGTFLRVFFLGSLIVSTPSFSCPEGLPKLSWSYEVSHKKGKEYRRVDIEIVKSERVSIVIPDNRLSYKTSVSPDGFIRVEVLNNSNETIKDIIISQRLEGIFEGLVRARRILSRSPLIVEDFINAPYNMEEGKLYIGIPILHAGEQLQLEYSIKASIIYRPKLVSPVVKKEEVRERVVKSYTFYFPLGKTKLNDLIVERLIMEISLLPSGEDYRIRVKGYADSAGSLPVNERIAKERAMNLISLITSRSLACLEKHHYAESLTGTPLEAK